MSLIKEFTTAVDEFIADDEEALTFMIDGQELRAFKPTEGQIALVMASVGRHASDTTKMAGIIDFFVSIMDEESHQYLVERLLSREDPLSLRKVEEVLLWLMEEWTGRPTQRSSGSTQSQTSGGPKSRRRTTKSTSSPSVPVSS